MHALEDGDLSIDLQGSVVLGSTSGKLAIEVTKTPMGTIPVAFSTHAMAWHANLWLRNVELDTQSSVSVVHFEEGMSASDRVFGITNSVIRVSTATSRTAPIIETSSTTTEIFVTLRDNVIECVQNCFNENLIEIDDSNGTCGAHLGGCLRGIHTLP